MNFPVARSYWREEFAPDFDIPKRVEDLILEGRLVDESWHNDACPSFSRPGSEARLWIEHPDPTLRDSGMEYRFFVSKSTDEEDVVEEPLYVGDDLEAAIRALEAA